MFTQAIAGDAISNGKILTYMPYCMILSQDENGIELEDYMLGDKKVKKTLNFQTFKKKTLNLKLNLFCKHKT